MSVAPHAGARVEIFHVLLHLLRLYSRPSRRGASRNNKNDGSSSTFGCRPSRRGASRNWNVPNEWVQCVVAPHAGARVEIHPAATTRMPVVVAPHAGARVEIEKPLRGICWITGRPSRRGASRNMAGAAAAFLVQLSPLTQGRE